MLYKSHMHVTVDGLCCGVTFCKVTDELYSTFDLSEVIVVYVDTTSLVSHNKIQICFFSPRPFEAGRWISVREGARLVAKTRSVFFCNNSKLGLACAIWLRRDRRQNGEPPAPLHGPFATTAA